MVILPPQMGNSEHLFSFLKLPSLDCVYIINIYVMYIENI